MLVQNVFADQVITTIQTSDWPKWIAVNPNTDMIYASVQSGTYPNVAGRVAVVDGATNNLVTSISVGDLPQYIDINPNTNKIYVTSNQDGVDVVDAATNTLVTKISGFSNAYDVAINSNTNRIYVTDQYSYSVSVIDGSTNSVTYRIPLSGTPYVAVDPTRNLVYIEDGNGTMSILDGSSNNVIKQIQGSGGGKITLNPTTNKIYDLYRGQVFVIDGSTYSIITTIPVSLTSEGIGANPITNKIYVANSDGKSFSVIDGSTNQIINTISLQSLPAGVGVNPNTNRIYLGSYSSEVSVIDGSSSTTTVPSAPQSLTATAVSSSQINLSWPAPSNNGGSPITGYTIERSADNGSTWSILISNTGSTATTFNDTGLASSTTYTYRVSAINSVGTSAPSNIASATTQQTPALSVAVLTNKSSYQQNSTVYVAVVVKSNSSPLSGASVTIHVCNPNNNCMTGTGTTNSNGNAIFKLAIPHNAIIGTYTVDATASKSGYTSGSGKTTFQVT